MVIADAYFANHAVAALGTYASSPFWLYKSCAVELGSVVAKLLNFSLAQQTVPRAWKTANITPVPKTSIVTGLGDLCPISVFCYVLAFSYS